jgi:hypothetical protein
MHPSVAEIKGVAMLLGTVSAGACVRVEQVARSYAEDVVAAGTYTRGDRSWRPAAGDAVAAGECVRVQRVTGLQGAMLRMSLQQGHVSECRID